jgi:starch-binding outer membrane protein, SusD/RagB family
MNIKKYFYLIFAACLITTSCSLDEEPYGFPSTGNFYKTADDANAALVYAYAILPEIEYYSRIFIMVTELPTETLTIKPDAGASNFEIDELRSRPDNPEITTTWRYGYIGINRANAVIANVPGIDMPEADRNEIVGEGHFLRALHYFNLVRLFGRVPLRTEPVNSTEQVDAPLSEISDIYDVIIADLEKAIELTDLQARDGRANKAAAWALLSKVYLHLASSKATGSPGYEFVPDADAYYKSAETFAGKVLNEQNVYSLDPDIVGVWDVTKEQGPEHIFSVSTDRTGQFEGNYSKLPLMFIPYIDGAVFQLEDGTSVASGWNHFLTEEGHYNSYDADDLRKNQLIVSRVWVNGNERNLGITDYSRPFTRKYVDPGRVGDQTSVNTPVLRFADILLVYAEAAGPTTEGYAAINQVRNRAGLPDLEENLSTDAFRDAVVRERSWELAFEGNRLFDLRRTNSMESVLEGEFGKNIQNGTYFFDIPQREVDTNPYID